MKITLFHNPTAGEETYTGKKLTSLLEKANHEVTYQSVKDEDYKEAYERPADLYLAAGGDGTVRRVAQQAITRKIPMSILATGTNNYVALALGIDVKPEKVIAKLETAERQRFDAGQAHGPWGEVRFVMGCGFGLLPRCLRLVERSRKKGKNVELLSLLHDKGAKAKAEYCTVILDGEKHSGKYFLVEIMNIPLLAPGLAFCPGVLPNDGFLHFVAATEEDRPAFIKALEKKEDICQFDLPVKKFQTLHIEVPDNLAHLDDRLRPKRDDDLPTSGSIDIKVLPGALQFLLPKVS